MPRSRPHQTPIRATTLECHRTSRPFPARRPCLPPPSHWATIIIPPPYPAVIQTCPFNKSCQSQKNSCTQFQFCIRHWWRNKFEAQPDAGVFPYFLLIKKLWLLKNVLIKNSRFLCRSSPLFRYWLGRMKDLGSRQPPHACFGEHPRGNSRPDRGCLGRCRRRRGETVKEYRAEKWSPSGEHLQAGNIRNARRRGTRIESKHHVK